jgi:hypothetical protein
MRLDQVQGRQPFGMARDLRRHGADHQAIAVLH